MKLEVTITVTNSNDPSCQRITLTEHHMVEMDGNSSSDIRSKYSDTERRFREVFPRNMTYTVPYTTIETKPVVETGVDAERLLRQAYASGQLNGTIIGGKLRDYFGVSYTQVEAEPYSDPAAQTVSLGDQHR